MADTSLKGRRDDVLPLRADVEQIESLQRTYATDDQIVDLGPYLRAIWEARRRIALLVLVTILLVVLVTSFVMRQTYRATAILRPVAKAATAGRIAGMFGEMGSGTLNPLAMLAGAGGEGSSEAEEYMTILQSFAFNTALIERHNLSEELSRPSSNPILAWFQSKDLRWRRYRTLSHRFDCEYSLKTGNLTLYFVAKTPAKAETILGYFIDDLREKLRSREVQGAAAAIGSMKDEARVTPDALLQAQLYELIAKQMQQLKLAQVEADFAFTVLEPPAAPDKPYSPNVLLDAAVAGFLMFILATAFVTFRKAVHMDSHGNR